MHGLQSFLLSRRCLISTISDHVRKSLFLRQTFSDFAPEGRYKNSRFHCVYLTVRKSKIKATSNNPCGQMKQDRKQHTNEKGHLIWWDELKTGDVNRIAMKSERDFIVDCRSKYSGNATSLPSLLIFQPIFRIFISAFNQWLIIISIHISYSSFRFRTLKLNLSTQIKYF